MEVILGVIAALVAGFLGWRFGAGRLRDQTRKIAVEAERKVRDKAADDAADALRANERRFEHDSKRPVDDVLTDAARRGGDRP